MKRVFAMLVTAAMILSLVGCSSAPPNTGSNVADSSLDESTDSPGDTSQYNKDADGDTEYSDDITYNPSRDYVTGDNYTPIMTLFRPVSATRKCIRKLLCSFLQV